MPYACNGGEKILMVHPQRPCWGTGVILVTEGVGPGLQPSNIHICIDGTDMGSASALYGPLNVPTLGGTLQVWLALLSPAPSTAPDTGAAKITIAADDATDPCGSGTGSGVCAAIPLSGVPHKYG